VGGHRHVHHHGHHGGHAPHDDRDDGHPGDFAATAGGRGAAALPAIFAVGLRPCSGALIVLVFALSQGLFAVGVAATFVMALGTGLTVAVLIALAVSAKGLAVRLAGPESRVAVRALGGIEIAAAALVLLLGLLLLGGALANGLP
jgi:ABC-type nickel/cobalt efflux system permease component RcnA